MENNNYLMESSMVLLDWSFWMVGGVASQFFELDGQGHDRR